MNNTKITILLSTLILLLVGFIAYDKVLNKHSDVADLGGIESIRHLKAIKDQEDADQRLGQYAINMMYHTSASSKLSDAKKQVLARAIVRVANEIFTTEEQRKAFVAVIAIESEFQRFAQSPTGPKGYAQLAKASFKEAMGICGLENIKDEDVWEQDLNLLAGACYFRASLEKNDGDTYAAIVSYNKGPNSTQVKSYSSSGSLSDTEALKYVAKFTYLNRKVNDEQAGSVIPFDPNTKSLTTDPQINTIK